MELDLATTRDIIRELRRREMRFVFIGMENSNSQTEAGVYLAGQGFGPNDVLKLIDLGQQAFEDMDDEDVRPVDE